MVFPLTDLFSRAWKAWGQGDMVQAVTLYRLAVQATPEDAVAHAFLGQALLANGEWSEGWAEHEWRPQPKLPLPRWQGQDIRGRTLLLVGEQGAGDNFQFVRFAERLASLGARVVVACQTGLGRLLSTVPGVAGVVEPGQPVGEVDYYVPMLSVPHALELAEDAFSVAVPYLAADPVRVEVWRRRLGDARGLKVGLIWAGNPKFPLDRLRSPRFAPYQQLLNIPGSHFYGLQLGDGRKDLERGAAQEAFTDLGGEIRDFDDTAAIMENLDLVISSCTSTAHLAGGLGRPLWVVLPVVADWRWRVGLERTPWYPAATLFRRRHGEEWDAVLGRVASALGAFRQTPGRRPSAP